MASKPAKQRIQRAKAPRQAAKKTIENKVEPAVETNGTSAPYHARIVLRRTGKKTLRFTGDCLAEATGYARQQSQWYEIAVYSRVVGGHVAAVRHFHKSNEQRDRLIAERFETLAEAVSFLENYRPYDELTVPFDPSCPTLSPAEAAIKAVGLRVKYSAYNTAYATVLGDILDSLHAHLGDGD
ncbi:MAG: hypothetical protein AAF562_13135 [Pseudomonadota bacterium]